jgi:hypothetical protein
VLKGPLCTGTSYGMGRFKSCGISGILLIYSYFRLFPFRLGLGCFKTGLSGGLRCRVEDGLSDGPLCRVAFCVWLCFFFFCRTRCNPCVCFSVHYPGWLSDFTLSAVFMRACVLIFVTRNRSRVFLPLFGWISEHFFCMQWAAV